MRIAILCEKTGFTPEQQKSLSSLGEVIYTASGNEIPLDQLIKLSSGADILAPDPTNLGGFEKAKPVLTDYGNFT